MKPLSFEKAAQAGLFGEAFVPSYPDAETDPHELFKIMKSDIILGRLDALGALEVMEKLFAVLVEGEIKVNERTTITEIGLKEIKGKVVVGYEILRDTKSMSEDSDTVRIKFKGESELDIYFQHTEDSKCVVVHLD